MQVITLDPAEQLLTRLRAVANSNHLVEQFYPLVTKEAGTRKAAIGAVMVLNLALHDYLARTGGPAAMEAVMEAVMRLYMPKWIEAVIGEGKPEFLAEALDFWKEVSS